MFRFLDHTENFKVGDTCYVPMFRVNWTNDEMLLDTWEGTIKQIINNGHDAIIDARTPSRCPKVVSIGLLGHSSIVAASRMFEWVEMFVDDYHKKIRK